MEIIQKNIILESSISRVPGLIPTTEMGFYSYKNNEWEKIDSYDGTYIEALSKNDFKDVNNIYFTYGFSGENGGNGNWGKYPLDIDFNKVNDEYSLIKDLNLPFVYFNIDNEKHSILRYRNMMDIYYWLINFYKEIKFYILCYRNGEKKWFEINNNFNSNNYELYSSLPTIENSKLNEIVGIHNDVFKLINMFKNNSNALLFINFVNKSIGKLYIDGDIDGSMVPEYLYYSEINEWYNWLCDNEFSNDCCIKDKYNEMGGEKMKIFLSDKLDLAYNTIQYFVQIVADIELNDKTNICPYINIPLYISNNIDDTGEFSLYSKEWISGTKYYVGDTVIYVTDEDLNGSSYTLAKGDEYELILMDDSFYEYVLNEKSIYVIETASTKSDIIELCNNEIDNNGNFIKNGKKIVYYDKENDTCYLPLAYYYGYYDENNKETYFDDVINNEIVLNHWTCNSDNESIRNLNIDGYDKNWPNVYVYDEDIKDWIWIYPDSKLVSNIESKLQTLRRYKKSYDDNGNELPGIITYSINDNDKKILNERLEFIFSVGEVHNLSETFDTKYNITYYHGDIIEEILYSEDNVSFINDKNNAKYIKFIYYIGVRLFEKEDENGDKYWSIYDENHKYYDGTKYEETYYITINKQDSNVIIDGEKHNIIYDEVDFDSNYSIIYNEDLDFAPIKTIFSNAISDVNSLFSKNYINDTHNIINIPLYKEEYLMGISTPIKRDVNVYIDRGINAAFERHLILSEINTFQDMENYRNDYFNFAQKN